MSDKVPDVFFDMEDPIRDARGLCQALLMMSLSKIGKAEREAFVAVADKLHASWRRLSGCGKRDRRNQSDFDWAISNDRTETLSDKNREITA
jgi:hypothetical protein